VIGDLKTHKFIVVNFLCFYASSIVPHGFVHIPFSCFGLGFLLFIGEEILWFGGETPFRVL
jgi:hypothetical protein